MFPDDRVRFERPDLCQISSQYTVCDLHFHSHYSDGLNSIPKIARCAREMGIGIAITDHNEIRGALEIEQYPDVLSIPGIEITSSEGTHLLIYFYESDQLKSFYQRSVKPHMGRSVMSSLGLSMFQIIDLAREYNSLIIFPHPYSAMYTGVYNAQFSKNQLQALLEAADGVEVINACNLKRWNLKSALLGFNIGKCMVGGSDGHALAHMGRAVTYAVCPKTRGDFLDAIRANSNQIIGSEISLIDKFSSNSLKLKANFDNSRDLLSKNLHYAGKVVALQSQIVCSKALRRFNAYKKAFNVNL